MNTHPDNTLWRVLNALPKPKPKYRLSLGDWLAATVDQRKRMDAWCLDRGYELWIDASDLASLNDHVRDMEPTRDFDKLENGHDDYEVFPTQGSSR